MMIMLTYTFSGLVNTLDDSKLRQAFATMRHYAVPELGEACLEDEGLAYFAAGIRLDYVDYSHVKGCCACTAAAMFYDVCKVEERADITNPIYKELRRAYVEETDRAIGRQDLPLRPETRAEIDRLLKERREGHM